MYFPPTLPPFRAAGGFPDHARQSVAVPKSNRSPCLRGRRWLRMKQFCQRWERKVARGSLLGHSASNPRKTQKWSPPEQRKPLMLYADRLAPLGWTLNRRGTRGLRRRRRVKRTLEVEQLNRWNCVLGCNHILLACWLDLNRPFEFAPLVGESNLGTLLLCDCLFLPFKCFL